MKGYWFFQSVDLISGCYLVTCITHIQDFQEEKIALLLLWSCEYSGNLKDMKVDWFQKL